MDNDPDFAVKLSLEQMYLLCSLLRSHIKDLKEFNNAERETAQAKHLLDTIATAKRV